MNDMTTNTKRSRAMRRIAFLSTLAASIIVAVALMFVEPTVDANDQINESGLEAIETAQTKVPAVRPRSGHSDYLRGLTQSALREGFGKDGVLLLAPQKGLGRDVVAKKLLAVAETKGSPLGRRLNLVGLKPGRLDDSHITFTAPNGYVKVSADGTKFVIRGDIDNPDEIKRARESGRMIEKAELEKIGRRFIREALGDFVKLGDDESLTFLGVKYLRDGNYDESGKGSEEVVANIAVFGREVRGVPVIGRGSKIAVWFANDREPVGVDVDWPVYRVTRMRQSVLSRDRLSERVKATTVPVTGSGKAEVARYECGYVDLGGRKRGTELQAGCAIHYAGRNDDGSLWGRVEYVPAGEKVNPDSAWPLARLLAGGKTMNTDTAEFARYASVKPPPKMNASPTKPRAKPR